MDVLAIFEKIASIPHCSGDTEQLRTFIVDFAKKCNFRVETDKAGNILCYRSKREIALQSHYDMVCIGKAPAIEIVRKDDALMAKDSSLGADDGIGVAIMLRLMQEGVEAEYLFTNDEEIGLVGASHLELAVMATKMINLDSEELGAIYIGCAGGIDLQASKPAERIRVKKRYGYHIATPNFSGGHSGVDIDKPIPNAIAVLARFLAELPVEIVSIEGGERINSIPAYAHATVVSDQKIESLEFSIEKREPKSEVLKNSKELVRTLCGFAHGVRGWNHEFSIPQKSINLAKIEVDEEIKIACSARSMDDAGLEELQKQSKCYFENAGYDVSFDGYYPPWEPVVSPFAKEARRIYEKYVKGVSFKAIHAGLECAIFSRKFPDISIVSIGPDISHPHSTAERLAIHSVEPLYQVVKAILCEK